MKDTFSIEIKRLTQENIDDVIEIEKKAYGQHHWSKDSFMTEIANELAKYFAAFDENGKLLGYAGCWQIIEEAHITNVAVSPECQRHHVGEALLNAIIQDCYENGIKYLTLEVRVHNTPAIGLYQKYGFKSLGTRKGYYQDNNEDALIMWTENIFYDKFKVEYNKIKNDLGRKISIKCQTKI
ncbi:MAG: ribosomal protein S18-alanine N-acetyltransferase [Clostridiaceae bacterium]|jgi:[ribosomal protein S18]-alanine N-acetyltransferase|nr:ribosomal protein S18-alanine N-acetyltransferase [Clostridiaceae bacterium]